MNSNPKVSVCITTYYHEKYISKALDSVLSQVVDFEYEICVSDDASQDKTVDILKEYAKKHSNIKLNLNKENVGLTRNFYLAYCMCKGDYIVDLSGDDYYIDNYKLQKQYDFLKNNKNYIGVTTAIESRFDDEEKRQEVFPNKKYINKPFSLKQFMKGHNIPLNGLMVINYWRDEKDRNDMSILIKASEYIDDITTSIKYLQRGDIFVLPDICTAYRIHRSSDNNKNFNSLNKGLSSFRKHILNLNYLYESMPELNFYSRYKVIVRDGILASLKNKSFKGFKVIYKTVPSKMRKKCLLINSYFSVAFRLPLYAKKLINLRKG